MLNMHCVKYRRSIVRSKIFWNILFFLKIIIEYSERVRVCVCVCVEVTIKAHMHSPDELEIVNCERVCSRRHFGIEIALFAQQSYCCILMNATTQHHLIWIIKAYHEWVWFCRMALWANTPFGYGRWIGFQLCLCYISPIERLHSFRYIAIAFTIIIKMNVYLKE